jgi:hypothetical protein
MGQNKFLDAMHEMQHVIRSMIKNAHRTGILLGKLCSHSTKTVEDKKFVQGICFLMTLRRKQNSGMLLYTKRRRVMETKSWNPHICSLKERSKPLL